MVSNAPELIGSAIAGPIKGYPGSNYIGPGTDLTQNLQPTSQMDDLARIHDFQYSQLEAKGVNPYFTFNLADRYMLAHADLTTAEGWAIYIGIGMKQIFPDDLTGVDPVPAWNGAGEDSSYAHPQEIRYWENYGLDQLAMWEKMEQASQEIADPNSMTNEERAPFISSLLGAQKSAQQTLSSIMTNQKTPQGGGAAAATGSGQPSSNPSSGIQPRDFGKDPFLRRFFLRDSTSEMGRGGPSALAHRVLSAGLSLPSPALRFLPTGHRFSLSSARNSVVTVASRKNMPVSSLAHPKTQRDYKRNMYTQETADSLITSRNGVSVPSFVKH